MKIPRQIANPGGELRVCLAQIDIIPGQPARNTCSMLAAIRKARKDGAAMVIFPEMAIPGYLLGDAWEQPAFLNECENCGRRILAAAQDIVVVFGNVALDRGKRNEDGRVRKYNALFVAADGRFHGPANGPYDFVIKTLMPNYREFDESRHFYDLRKLAAEMHVDPASLIAPVTVGGLRLGCVLCEDAWDADYSLAPLPLLSRHNPHLYLNCSCSPFTRGKNGKRRRVFAMQAAALQRPLIYVNAVGLQNNGKSVYVFDGASCIYQGRSVVRQLPAFTPACETHTLALDTKTPAATPTTQTTDETAEVFGALQEGARRFLQICGVKRVVVGLSGGIDSALTAAIYARILPPEDLLAVNLPTQHNSPTTINLARKLARNLDCLFAEVPIGEAVELTRRQLHQLPLRNSRIHCTLELSDTIMENVQARDRSARILAAMAGAFDAVFTCNAN
ncbi:MAG: NAD(+) synthase, partial [Lentisphaerae bacterium]|nr:NAD(+) synthase [Lentisphaerota bacterium]